MSMLKNHCLSTVDSPAVPRSPDQKLDKVILLAKGPLDRMLSVSNL